MKAAESSKPKRPAVEPAADRGGRPTYGGYWWAAAIAVYFVYFVHDSLRVRFAPDDLMNMDYYWRLGWGKLLGSFVAPWRGGYRPMGGLFYLPLLRVFGLDPAPYHAAMLAILAANAWLVYRLARKLRCPETASALAALLVCYHGGLSFLYFNTSFIYDALCTFFYLAAVVYYIGRRAEGERLTGRQIAMFSALCWCALNSKEMAVTLPGVLLAYEWLFQKRPSVRGAVWAAVLAAPIVLRVLVGPGALTGIPEYRPELSLARIGAFHRDAMADFFEAWHFFTIPTAVAAVVLITIAAWWPKRAETRFCWCWLALTPVPIELLEGRTNACLALPVCGLAILAGVLFTELARVIADGVVRGGGRLRTLESAPLRNAVFAVVVAAGVGLWAVQNAQLKRRLIVPQMRKLGDDTGAAIDQLEALHPQVGPHSTVIFLNDPFEDFDMAFIADLYFRQPGVNVKLRRKTPVGPEELAAAGRVFDYRQGQLTLVR